MKPLLLLLLLLSSVLVPIGSIQPALGSTVFLGQAQGMLVTSDYQSSSEAAENDDQFLDANRLLGMAGDRSKTSKTGEFEADSKMKMFGPGEGRLGMTEAGSIAAPDHWDRSMKASKLCNQALLHIKRDQLPQATKALEQAAIIDPAHTRARLLRGVVAAKQRQHREAIGFYNSALALDPTDAEIYQSRGISYMELKKNAEAIGDFTKAMELDPKLVEAYLKRGLLYGQLGRFEESIADNSAAIALDPENLLAYNNRSAAYRALGKLDLARADLQMLKKLQQMGKP